MGMSKAILFLCAAALALGADDSWTKVKELKSGAELRVYKRGTAQPLTVKFDELTDENLLVVNKNAQVAIPRDEIDRIDARPTGKRSVTKETTNKTAESTAASDPRSTIPGPDQPRGGAGGGTSSSSSTNVSFGGKPDFETVYRRQAQKK